MKEDGDSRIGDWLNTEQLRWPQPWLTGVTGEYSSTPREAVFSGLRARLPELVRGHETARGLLGSKEITCPVCAQIGLEVPPRDHLAQCDAMGEDEKDQGSSGEDDVWDVFSSDGDLSADDLEDVE